MCGVDICPVHTRTDVVEAVQANVPARAIEYHGEYAVATLDNPEFENPLSALGALFGQEPPNMFVTLVVKVGSGPLGDVMDAGNLESATVFKETFLSPGDGRLDEFRGLSPFAADTSTFNQRLTEIMHESHKMVMSSVKEGLIS